jgi:single-strand DNA-binding protein
MSFEIEGLLHKKFDTESKTETFQAREFVIKTSGTYPQYIKFQLTQDRCSIIDPCNEGDTIKVYFDLRGREWNEKYFTNLNAWKVEVPQAQAPTDSPSFNEEPPPGFGSFDSAPSTPADGGNTTQNDFDDLPF